MRLLIALIGAGGLFLAYWGLPAVRGGRLSRRVEPYVSGVRGRPSTLLGWRSSSARGRIEAAVASFLRRTGLTRDEGLAERLAAAGLEPSPGAFRLDQIVWALTAMVGSWVLATLSLLAGISFDLRALPLFSVLALAVGGLGRDWWLTKQVIRRQQAIREELPAAIDLMTLSIMAGESVPAAFDRVAQVLPGAVGTEFSSVVGDIRSGAGVHVALEQLKLRVPIAGIERLADALATAIDRGSPLAEVLRAQSEDGRETRRRELIELGGRREVLMLVPVVFLILPVVVVFALFPGLVSLNLLIP